MEEFLSVRVYQLLQLVRLLNVDSPQLLISVNTPRFLDFILLLLGINQGFSQDV